MIVQSYPRHIESPRLPTGPYATLLTLIAEEPYIDFVKSEFPCHKNDQLYGDRGVGTGTTHWLSFYIDRPYLSNQQTTWMIEESMGIQRHWWEFRNQTMGIPVIGGRIYPLYTAQPELPTGLYATSLTLISEEPYVNAIKSNFPCHEYDQLYGDRKIGTTHWLNFYIARPYISDQQTTWLIENSTGIQRHWMAFRNQTTSMPAIKKG